MCGLLYDPAHDNPPFHFIWYQQKICNILLDTDVNNNNFLLLIWRFSFKLNQRGDECVPACGSVCAVCVL